MDRLTRLEQQADNTRRRLLSLNRDLENVRREVSLLKKKRRQNKSLQRLLAVSQLLSDKSPLGQMSDENLRIVLNGILGKKDGHGGKCEENH